MFIFEIPVALILALVICAAGFGWGIISNIDKILSSLGIGVLVLIGIVILFIIIFAIGNLLWRRKIAPTIVVFIVTLCLLMQGASLIGKYQHQRFDAFYTKNEISVEGVDKYDESVYCTIPAGSLVSEVERNTKIKSYSGFDSIPTTLNCKYIDENGNEIMVEIEKSNIEKCGWIDYFGKLHEEKD